MKHDKQNDVSLFLIIKSRQLNRKHTKKLNKNENKR